jgi:ATP-dependent exoDNAse (exonuclease V) beta subunit
MFKYHEITTETVDNKRWYHTPKGPYPSITTVLNLTESAEKKASLASWRTSLGEEKARQVSLKACDHGTAVHLLAERYLKRQDPFELINGEPVQQADKAAFNALKLKLDKIDEVWGQEVPLYSTELEVAGRCDLVGKYKGVPVIVDFKTAGRIKGHKDINDYRLQLAFYARAHNEMFGSNIQDGVILMVAQTGFPMEFNVKLAEYKDELEARVKTCWTHILSNA